MAKRFKKRHPDAADQEVPRTGGPESDLPAQRFAESESSRESFPVVGIVASAGGLEAFKSFFAAMPANSGLAFVLVPHLDAQHKSALVELLARQTAMPVAEATEGTSLEVNSVYIIPPNRCLSLSRGKLHLSDFPDRLKTQTAMDFFLRSLAVDQRRLAIGVVFSGTGSHGTLGIREIKRCGGLVIAQSPDSAEFNQMPRSAIETGLVDFILPPNAIPEAILDYARHSHLAATKKVRESPSEVSAEVQEIIDLVRARTKLDFRPYRPHMILRRIERRMGLMKSTGLADYAAFLRSHPEEIEALSRDFLIGVTAFFREADAFTYLEKSILPPLIAKLKDEAPLRVWVPSCATGEEAYSIGILLLEAFAAAGRQPQAQIFASDISQRSIKIARRGIYLDSIAVDVSASRLQKYFVPYDDFHYQVTKQLRDLIVFSNQNVISDAPFSKLDLISCRNLMIYLEPETQQKLISLFHYALVENGHLLLGPAETVGRATNLFKPVSKKWRVYRRQGPRNPGAPGVAAANAGDLPGRTPKEQLLPTPRQSYRELTESNLRDWAPTAALVNSKNEVLYLSGTVVNFLEFPPGELSKDLLAMARPGLRSRLRNVCHQARTLLTTITDTAARVQRNGLYVPCSLIARPIQDSPESEVLVLVVLQDHPKESSPNSDPSGFMPVKALPSRATGREVDSGPLLQQLEFELQSTREELRNSVEEMEFANEELQSSNEELESSKEELQSLNEELSTVNCQLLEKVSELDKSNSEITSLMASTEIATLYLDKQLRIRRFTHPTMTLFRLLPTDEGRDVRDFASPVMDDQLLENCQQVLKLQEIQEREIWTPDGFCYLRRITPFLTTEQQVDGVVITFVDLTATKRLEAQQRERDLCFRQIFEHAATGIAIADLEGALIKCNPAFCQLVGYTPEELSSIPFLMLIHTDDRCNAEANLLRLRTGQASSLDLENRYVHQNGSVVLARDFISLLPDSSGKNGKFMALVTDVSTLRRTIEALQQSEHRIHAILKTASDAIITIDQQGVIETANQSTETIFGYSNSELIGQNVTMLMPQHFQLEHNGYIQRFLSTGEPHVIGRVREVLCRRKDGSTFPADLAVSQVDHLGLFTGILRDISTRKQMQRHILEVATEEQRRIGLELHDGTQQELTGLSLYANALQETIRRAQIAPNQTPVTWQLPAEEFERLRATADLLAKRLTETHRHVRDLAHGIMPIQIDADGLRSALTELARSINANQKVSCVLDCQGQITIPDNTTATHLYRIAQEAINNAIRHGSADEILIRLILRNERIVLEILDNGVGIDVAIAQRTGGTDQGMGMRAMEYRANLIGGRIQVEHRPSGGTLVRCIALKRDGNN